MTIHTFKTSNICNTENIPLNMIQLKYFSLTNKSNNNIKKYIINKNN